MGDPVNRTLTFLVNYPSAFCHVIRRPKWHQIAPVKAGLTLGLLSKIEGAAWSYVVDVPSAVVLPCHAELELLLNVTS